MGNEQRLETRSKDGQVLLAFDRYSAGASRALQADLEHALGTSVDFGAQGQALYATDASNYRQVPLGVACPRSRQDVVEIVRICREHDAPILARGGGTSLAGQGCNVALCVDFSRHLHHVIDVDPDARTARVEPGCILDRLQDAATPHGLMFGPDPATHDHNTLGGMIGNDSCGVHSVKWGRTIDNVGRLDVLTYDGLQLELGPTPEPYLQRRLDELGRRGDIYRALVSLRNRYGALVEERFPKIPRLVSGFEGIAALLAGGDFNVARAVTGTEGTCVVVLDAEVQLVPRPNVRAIALLSFDDVFAAADAVPALLEQKPDGLEGFDDKMFDAVRTSRSAGGLDAFPDGHGFLIVEAGGDTPEQAQANVRRIVKRAHTGGRCHVVTDAAEQARVWKAREAALGVTAFVRGKPEHWPGWEDSAVPPDNLGDYLRELERLFAEHGYTAALYGHFGDGVTHCRVNFDFDSEAGLASYRQFMREAAHLVHRYGGSLSGEHGDGQSRAELLGILYGDELLQCFREFKGIWDPGNRLNPGKAIDPFPIDSNLRLGLTYRPRPLDTHFRFPDDHGFAHATTRCVGVGKCRRRSVGDEVMCPSYLATGEEKHSTRGRAHLLHEMARGEVIADGWASHVVEDALSLCLSCKGCKADCPVGVDVATWKAEFRAHHYAARRRPRSARIMSYIDRWAGAAAYAPAVANALAGTTLAKRVAGIHSNARLPRFAAQTFRAWFADRGASAIDGDRVLLWCDTFNDHFRPQTLIAATELLERAGFKVALPSQPLCCGRPLYDWGYLDRAKQQFERILDNLASEIAAGTPIIVCEPACASAFKDELRNLFAGRAEAERLSNQVHYVADFVAERIDRFPEFLTGGSALVQPHCHHHAVIGFGGEKRLLDRLGLSVERPPQGCCGMAGAFGMARDTFDVARAIGERVLLPRVRKAHRDTIILADGFSCREQIETRGHRRTMHIVELLRERMI